MKITIHKDQLIGPLEQAHKAIESKNAMPILTHVHIDAGEKITLIGTDLEIQIKTEIDVAADQPGSTCIPADKFIDIIKSLPKDSIIKISTQNDKTIITSGRSRFSLNGLPTDIYPDFLCKTEHQIYLPADVLKKALKKTSFAMANNDVRVYLNGVLIHIANKQLQLVGSDGHQLAFFRTQIDSDINAKIILPRKSITNLIQLIESDEDLMKIEFSSSHFVASFSNVEFSSKLIDSNYPDFSKIYEQDFYPELQIDTLTLKSALQRALVLSNQKFKGLNLTLTQSELMVTSRNEESDEAEESIEIEGPETDIAIAFNGDYLVDALNHIDSIKFNLNISLKLSICIIKDALDDSFEFIVMPMRL